MEKIRIIYENLEPLKRFVEKKNDLGGKILRKIKTNKKNGRHPDFHGTGTVSVYSRNK